MKKLVLCLLALSLVTGVAYAGDTPVPATDCPEAAAVVPTPDANAPSLFERPAWSTDAAHGVVQNASGGCSAWMTCHDGQYISCTTSTSGASCFFEESDCANNYRGNVTCGWNEVHCNSCPYTPPSGGCRENKFCTDDNVCSGGFCFGNRCVCP